jgi:hypothetical protein
MDLLQAGHADRVGLAECLIILATLAVARMIGLRQISCQIKFTGGKPKHASEI